MKYVRIQAADPVIDYVVSSISSRLLSGERVAWLLSGGSAIDIEVRIAQKLQAHDRTMLYIGLIDERYGAVGHKNENFLQLMNAGFPLYLTRVLRGDPSTPTATSFGAATEEALRKADYSLGIFGIGDDGHTAGIKPTSPSVTSTEPAIFYEWDDYQRITLTPTTIRALDEAVIYAVGEQKKPALASLLYENLPLPVQPAQVLKDIKKTTLFTDSKL